MVDLVPLEGLVQSIFDEFCDESSFSTFVRIQRASDFFRRSNKWISVVRQTFSSLGSKSGIPLFDSRDILKSSLEVPLNLPISEQFEEPWCISQPSFIAQPAKVPCRFITAFINESFERRYASICERLTNSQAFLLVPRIFFSGCDIIINEKTCLKVVTLGRGHDHEALQNIIKSVLLILSNYEICYLVFIVNPLRDFGFEIRVVKFIGALQLFQNHGLCVVVRFFENEEEVPPFIREISEAAGDASEIPGEYANQSWINQLETRHERFLSLMYGFDPFKALVLFFFLFQNSFHLMFFGRHVFQFFHCRTFYRWARKGCVKNFLGSPPNLFHSSIQFAQLKQPPLQNGRPILRSSQINRTHKKNQTRPMQFIKHQL